MNINERIARIDEYFASMSVEPSDGKQVICVRVKWPDKWTVADDTKDKFSVDVYENGNELIFFCDIVAGFDAIFDAIDYNIKLNLDAAKKAELYRKKQEILRGFFLDANNSIDMLENLQIFLPVEDTNTNELKDDEIQIPINGKGKKHIATKYPEEANE